jgi:hypothetical protein
MWSVLCYIKESIRNWVFLLVIRCIWRKTSTLGLKEVWEKGEKVKGTKAYIRNEEIPGEFSTCVTLLNIEAMKGYELGRCSSIPGGTFWTCFFSHVSRTFLVITQYLPVIYIGSANFKAYSFWVWGSRSGDYELCSLMECGSVLSSRNSMAFRRNILSPTLVF